GDEVVDRRVEVLLVDLAPAPDDGGEEVLTVAVGSAWVDLDDAPALRREHLVVDMRRVEGRVPRVVRSAVDVDEERLPSVAVAAGYAGPPTMTLRSKPFVSSDTPPSVSGTA